MVEKEIEIKSMLDKSTYEELLKQLERNEFSQINHYFDSEDFSLKSQNMALRVREKDGNYKLTLKVKKDAILTHEISDVLDREQFCELLNNRYVNTENVANYLQDCNLGSLKLVNIISFETIRNVVEFKDYKLFLDHTIYDNSEDFELEIEAKSVEVCKQTFAFYAKKYNLTRNYVTKIARAYKNRECR